LACYESDLIVETNCVVVNDTKRQLCLYSI
jgi:hypothetical protein